MKSYTITVNGTAYEVTVEETGSVSAPAAAPKAAPKAAPAAAPKAAAPAAGAGAVKVTASVPGKVVKVAASVGQAVKAGDSVIILESMKMEIPVVAPQDGTIVNELKEVSRSYKEARMALDVGKIFFGDKEVIAYSSLGIGRLIYQLPIPLCKMFIKEIFGGKSPDDFDEETLVTIDKFFENSLNVSETSRQLYIHRNTLVYRLDKLQKSTGLDLRVFEDAITFKIALMVVRYMKYMETLEY